MPTTTECKTTCFVSRGGQQPGTGLYPDQLRLELTEADAWRVVHELLGKLERRQTDDLKMSLLGELTEELDESLALFELTE